MTAMDGKAVEMPACTKDHAKPPGGACRRRFARVSFAGLSGAARRSEPRRKGASPVSTPCYAGLCAPLCLAAILALALSLTGCHLTISPKGEAEERARAERAGAVFSGPVEKRPLPDLATSPTLPLVLEYAFNANGDIEAAYREWRAALERIPQAGALPDPRLNFNVLFNVTNVKSFSDVLQNASLMLEQEFPGRGKRPARAEVALAQARGAGEKFRAEKYRLQKRAIGAYSDLLLNRSFLDLNAETLRLLKETYEVALHRYHAMSDETQVDLRKIETEIEVAESEKRELGIRRGSSTAELNGVLNRAANAPLGALQFPLLTRPAESEADLFARAVRSNPDLGALRREIEARGAAQVLADLEKRPDLKISGGAEAGGTGSIMPSVGAEINLPVNRARIRAGIAEALAMREAAEARLRSLSSDVQARVVMALASLRDAERVLKDYRERIIPQAKSILEIQQTTYGSGGGDLLDILDTERLLVDYRKMTARAESDRLRSLSELEEAIGEDLFQFIPGGEAEGAAAHD